jgi:hypothetical protein
LEVLEVFYNGGYLPTVYFTAGPGAASELVGREAPSFDMVVCIGETGP